jgi:hypothetical protein
MSNPEVIVISSFSPQAATEFAQHNLQTVRSFPLAEMYSTIND